MMQAILRWLSNSLAICKAASAPSSLKVLRRKDETGLTKSRSLVVFSGITSGIPIYDLNAFSLQQKFRQQTRVGLYPQRKYLKSMFSRAK